MKGGVRENSKGKKDESKQEERKVRNVESPGKKNQLEIDAEWKKSEDQNKMEEQKEKAVRNPGKDNVLDWEVQENERKDAEDKVKAAVALIRMLLV